MGNTVGSMVDVDVGNSVGSSVGVDVTGNTVDEIV